MQATKVEARPGYRIYVEFSDGVAGELDLSTRLFGSVFAPLKDESLFKQVRIDEFGAPCWPNGADLAPDAIHQRLVKTNKSPQDFEDPKTTVELLDELVGQFHMTDEQFRGLHHAENYEASIRAMRHYCTDHPNRPARFQQGGTNSVTARRLAICLERLRQRSSWADAIAAALAEFPK